MHYAFFPVLYLIVTPGETVAGHLHGAKMIQLKIEGFRLTVAGKGGVALAWALALCFVFIAENGYAKAAALLAAWNVLKGG